MSPRSARSARGRCLVRLARHLLAGAVAVVALTWTWPVVALQWDAVGLVTASGTLLHSEPKPGDTQVGLYGYGMLFWNTRHRPWLYTYFGPEWQKGRYDAKLLTGTVHGPDGQLQVISSGWLGVRDFPAKGWTSFAEVDGYWKALRAPRSEYFAMLRALRTLTPTSSVGVWAEVFGDGVVPYHAAVGPVLTMNKLRWFVAYDGRPGLPDSRVFVRMYWMVF